MDEFNEMLKLFPEIILTSKYPPVWKGVLTIYPNNNVHNKMKIKVKFVVPLFPQLNKAQVYFGSNIATLFGTSFRREIELIIEKSDSVSEFFQELTKLIQKLYNDTQNYNNLHHEFNMKATENILNELRNMLSEYSDVELSSTKKFNALKLTMNDISMIVQHNVTSTGQSCWKIISSDLPPITNCTTNGKKSFSLREIRNLFQKQINTMEDAWYQLQKIDNFCWVTDPIHPKPYHLYRRIFMSPKLSFLLTIDPMDPTGYPKLNFLGAKSEVEKYQDIVQNEDSIEKWDLEYSVYENLLTLLNIDEFPQDQSMNVEIKKEGVVDDEECCICFSLELEDHELPDEICNNQKCSRRFHSSCLFQWLQELVTNKIVFNKIFGPCPNCGEEVSCNVPSS